MNVYGGGTATVSCCACLRVLLESTNPFQEVGKPRLRSTWKTPRCTTRGLQISCIRYKLGIQQQISVVSPEVILCPMRL